MVGSCYIRSKFYATLIHISWWSYRRLVRSTAIVFRAKQSCPTNLLEGTSILRNVANFHHSTLTSQKTRRFGYTTARTWNPAYRYAQHTWLQASAEVWDTCFSGILRSVDSVLTDVSWQPIGTHIQGKTVWPLEKDRLPQNVAN